MLFYFNIKYIKKPLKEISGTLPTKTPPFPLLTK